MGSSKDWGSPFGPLLPPDDDRFLGVLQEQLDWIVMQVRRAISIDPTSAPILPAAIPATALMNVGVGGPYSVADLTTIPAGVWTDFTAQGDLVVTLSKAQAVLAWLTAQDLTVNWPAGGGVVYLRLRAVELAEDFVPWYYFYTAAARTLIVGSPSICVSKSLLAGTHTLRAQIYRTAGIISGNLGATRTNVLYS